jgi:hypothetical protein
MQSDSAYFAQCNPMAHLLIEVCGGNAAAIPQHYLDNFHHDFADGDISLVPALSKLDDEVDLSPEELDETLEALQKVNPNHWPAVDVIENIDPHRLLNLSGEFENLSENFVEDNLGTAEKVERVLKGVIESVFGGTVNSIRDPKGEYPSSSNDFLQEDDGTFSGTFQHEGHHFRFEIAPTEQGWICTYRMEESSLDKIPQIVKDAKRDNKESTKVKSVRSQGWK